MKAKRILPPWTPFAPATYSSDPAEHAKMMATADTHELFKNSRYTVNVRHLTGGWTHLSFKRNDRNLIHDWREVQRIKNEICGPEREGIELYPAESRLVDTATQWHIWVAPEGVKIPIGFDEGRTVLDKTGAPGKAKQREQEVKTEDMATATELIKKYERIAAEKHPFGSPEYYDCIVDQRRADLAKDAATPEETADERDSVAAGNLPDLPQ
jgi:hypothetical protein